MRLRPSPISLFIWLLLPQVLWAQASKPRLVIEHTVSVTDPASELFQVKSRFADLRQTKLSLALPAWSPGSYMILDYAQNILRMRFTDESGRPLSYRMTRKSTWEVDTQGVDEVRVEFDYRADKIARNQAKVAGTYALFTGTQLFLEPIGHRASPATVRFIAPAGWGVLSAMRATSDPMVFRADNYDELVDSPTQLGMFDLARYPVDGVPHYFSVTPPGTFTPDETARLTDAFSRITRAAAAMFGGQPYDKYVAFYFFLLPNSNAITALEHLNSHVSVVGVRGNSSIENYLQLYAHELFHAWNVKRLRPAELWRYDYSDVQETPLLWFAEGLTNYYADVLLLRTGLVSDSLFRERVALAIASHEDNEARKYKSLADASVSTWFRLDSPAFLLDYYGGGHVIGALLDVLVRNDTRGQRSLDDVMRHLWNNHYRKGKGFTTSDFLAALNAVSGRNHSSFVQRYVQSTAVPPYDSILAAVGYRFELKRQRLPRIGILDYDSTALGVRVKEVAQGGPLEAAGGKDGDIIMSINGGSPFPILPSDLIGKDVIFVISRAGEQRTLTVKLGSREDVTGRLIPIESPTPEQLALRRGWLARTP